MGENQRRGHAAEQVDRFLDRRLIVHDEPVALVQAMILGPDQRGRLGGLDGPPGADRPAGLGGRAAIARRGRGDVNLPAGLGQADQRARAEKLGVVGMGHEGQGNSRIPAASWSVCSQLFHGTSKQA